MRALPEPPLPPPKATKKKSEEKLYLEEDARKALELFDEAVERDPDTNFCKIILYFVLETRPPPGASFFLTPLLRWPPSPLPCPRTGPLPAYTSVPRAG